MPRRFGRLAHSLRIDFKTFTFVDLGCGKGRTLVMAAELGFRRVIGVEIEKEFATIARSNVRTAVPNSAKVEVLEIDAGTYELPLEPLVIYMFNPFMEKTMRRVLGEIARSLAICPRPLYLIYHGPTLRSLVDAEQSLQRLRVGRDSAVYRDAGRSQS